jgi:nicotinate phosphoribosyltransferase
MRKWRIASDDEILEGRTTDTYFENTVEVLKQEKINPIVHAEVTISALPEGPDWAIVAGVNDAIKLFENKRISIQGLPEGTLIYPADKRGVKVPVLSIEGPYTEFAVLETPMLGFMCYTSGLVTRAAYIRQAAGNKMLLSFGARRTHPAITPQVEYAAYIGGCDGVSCVLGAELLNLHPSGTMPHALVVSIGNQVKAWQAFDRHVSDDIPRVAIIDTYSDEVAEAVLAAQNVANLSGVRVDTPSSRRGSLREIIEEIRWELDLRGFRDTKIYASGGLGYKELIGLKDAPVDGYGVGGAISNAPSIDFAMDIVSVQREDEWVPAAKRGKFSGRKVVWRCRECGKLRVTQSGEKAPVCDSCNKPTEQITTQLLNRGQIVEERRAPSEIREYIHKQLERADIL